MGRTLRRSAIRWVALLAIPFLGAFLGCQDAELVTIEIPDFDTHSIDGVWVWRQAADEVGFERDTEIRILSHHEDGVDGEYVVYSVRDAQGREVMSLPAAVIRDELSPKSAQISFLIHLSRTSGIYRASTYNAIGESDLSTATLELSSS